MAVTCSTLAMSTCCPLREEALPEEEDDAGDDGLLRNHRIAKKPTRATAMI